MTNPLKTMAARIKNWREERGILRFIDEQFKVKLDPWQEEACLAFADPRPEMRRISLQACAGPGKSAVQAWCGCWFIGTQGDAVHHPKGAAVSISKENLSDNLWAEYQKWMNVSPYMSTAFTWTSGRIFANDHPGTWFISARAWPKSANADEQGKTLSGLHSKYVMAQADESGAIPTTVLRAAEQALSNCEFGKIMQSGNPISLEGMLHAAANELRAQWYVIRITGDPDDPKAWVHSPRFKAQHVSDDPEKCGCPKCWSVLQIRTYGRDNPWVKSYILGQFPPASINTLLGIEEVEAAMQRTAKADAWEWAQKRLGVDVARFGDDRTVIFPRQGLAAFRPVIMRGARTTDIAARVASAREKWGGNPIIFVDDTFAWGNGVIDNLHAAHIPCIRLNYASPAIDRRYKNRRAEFWLQGVEWVKRGGILPYIPEMVAELTTPTYTFHNGQFVLEEKAMVKARLGRSPDLADALFETFALPEAPSEVDERLRAMGLPTSVSVTSGVGRALSDFDPFQGPFEGGRSQ